jgi:large subunit ribosomal protein L5
MNRLQEKYTKEVAPALMSKFGYKSVMQIPKITKVVINQGLGEAASNSKIIEEAMAELEIITGQKPLATKAKESIATFKVREGQQIGAKVTLRGKRMYQFLDKLFNVSLARIRDFRGISDKSFDGRGNYTLGLKEQVIFPEIEFDKVKAIRGMDIVIVTTATNNEEGRELLTNMGMPFVKRGE